MIIERPNSRTIVRKNSAWIVSDIPRVRSFWASVYPIRVLTGFVIFIDFCVLAVSQRKVQTLRTEILIEIFFSFLWCHRIFKNLKICILSHNNMLFLILSNMCIIICNFVINFSFWPSHNFFHKFSSQTCSLCSVWLKDFCTAMFVYKRDNFYKKKLYLPALHIS